jgi:FKBP-type peptidyl-prolyl cis-trans isomerase SlyD
MSDPTITAGKIVGFHYTLRNDEGEELDSSAGGAPLEYLHGAGNIVPGLEKALADKDLGFEGVIDVEPDDGYGQRDEAGVFEVDRTQFPEDAELALDMVFGIQTGDDQPPQPAWITAMADDKVTLDFNHPLAGQRLHFDVSIVSIRDATEAEASHGHPGAGEGCGCGHDHG